MPVVVLPQFFLCGLLVARAEMAGWLHAISDVLPLTWAVDALQQVGTSSSILIPVSDITLIEEFSNLESMRKVYKLPGPK